MQHVIATGGVEETLRGIPDNTFHAVLSDPPYGLAFMGKKWDYDLPSVEALAEILRVLRPGGYAMFFGGTRTFHRLAVRLEDVGFELRDTLCWLYGTGFPKSMDVSKQLDASELTGKANSRAIRAARAHRQQGPLRGGSSLGYRKLGIEHGYKTETCEDGNDQYRYTTPTTPLAKMWSGYGTALKPAWEPILLVRKPPEGTVAANVARWGCGALAVDACRIEGKKDVPASAPKDRENIAKGRERGRTMNTSGFDPNIGRWPANVLLDEEAAAVLDEVVGERPSTLTRRKLTYAWCPHCKAAEPRDLREWPLGSEVKCGACGERYELEIVTEEAPASAVANPSKVRGKRNVLAGKGGGGVVYADNGGPSRFFKVTAADKDEPLRFMYTAKVSTRERNAGCEHLPKRSAGEVTEREDGSDGLNSPRAGAGRGGGAHNHHPTLKPLALTEYLARLLEPPGGGALLVPYAGSGSEMIGALRAGWTHVLGVERDPEYVQIAEARIAHWITKGRVAA